MARSVNVYVKKQLRLARLSIPQQEMYRLGQVGLASIKMRVKRARGPDDGPSPRLKSEIWKRIKKSKGLPPIRDLQGTGMMAQKGGKKKGQLKFVGHLLDQLLVRRVSDTTVQINEPSTRAGRLKARGNRGMLLFSAKDKETIASAAKIILRNIVRRLGMSTPGERA